MHSIHLLLCMQITGDLNDEYLIMSMISRHAKKAFYTSYTVTPEAPCL